MQRLLIASLRAVAILDFQNSVKSLSNHLWFAIAFALALWVLVTLLSFLFLLYLKLLFFTGSNNLSGILLFEFKLLSFYYSLRDLDLVRELIWVGR